MWRPCWIIREGVSPNWEKVWSNCLIWWRPSPVVICVIITAQLDLGCAGCYGMREVTSSRNVVWIWSFLGWVDCIDLNLLNTFKKMYLYFRVNSRVYNKLPFQNLLKINQMAITLQGDVVSTCDLWQRFKEATSNEWCRSADWDDLIEHKLNQMKFLKQLRVQFNHSPSSNPAVRSIVLHLSQRYLRKWTCA